ncbi:MAG: NAD(P)H-binding protein [Gemmatimonadales bacterium]|jgi:uncharacterized protein YbjT (DUF2867 family)
MTERAALVAGATGLVGGHCLDLLLADPGYAAVHSVGRRPSGRTSPKLTEHIVDFADLANLTTIAAVDLSVFCCLGTTMRRAGSRAAFRRVDLEYPLALAHAARDVGARCFVVVSALGADPGGATFYARVKGELERELRAVGFPSLIIARPSLLLGDRTEFRLGERVAAMLGRVVGSLLVGGLRRYRPIHARMVARALGRLADERPPGVRVVESHELAELASVT